MNKLFFLLLSIFSILEANAQSKKNIELNFLPMWHQEMAQAETSLIENTDTIQFRTLKFYVSQIAFYQNDQCVFTEKNSFHLIDCFENKNKIMLTVPGKIIFNKVIYSVGIDSAAHANSKMTGDLDPLKGMYWTWQSGYINVKMEGDFKNQMGSTAFRYHLGGYRLSNNCMQRNEFKVSHQQLIEIKVDVRQLCKGLPFQQTPNIMSPGKVAVSLSKTFSDAFSKE